MALQHLKPLNEDWSKGMERYKVALKNGEEIDVKVKEGEGLSKVEQLLKEEELEYHQITRKASRSTLTEKKPGPDGYMTGLSDEDEEDKKDQMKKQAAMSDDDPDAYEEMPGDEEAREKGKVKKSKHTKAYHKKFGENMQKLKTMDQFLTESVDEAFIGPFVFNDKMSDEELKDMYDAALDGYANYSKGFQHPKSKYKQAYQEIEKILKKRGVSVDEAVSEASISHAEIRKLEKHLSPNNKRALTKAIKDGTIKTSEDLSNWVKSIDEDVKLVESINEDYDKMLDRRYGRNRDYTNVEIKDIHFQTDAEELQKMKLEYGYRMGGVTNREKIEDADYALRKYRKEIKYGDGKDVGVFQPDTPASFNSKLMNGPHTKARPKVRWNQRKYDQWIDSVAANGGAENAFDMAQNAKMEPGLVDWVKKNIAYDEDPMLRIQYDIEAMAESVNEAEKYDLNFKIGDTVDLLSDTWEIIGDMKPNKKFPEPFTFQGKDMKQLPIYPPSTNKYAEGYKVRTVETRGYTPQYGFLYQYTGTGGKLITKLAIAGVPQNESVQTSNDIEKAFNILEGVMGDLHIIASEAKDEDSFVKTFFKDYGDKIKKSKESEEWVRSLYKDTVNEKNKGLWHNIRAKRKRGEAPAKKGSKAYKKAKAAADKINNEELAHLKTLESFVTEDRNTKTTKELVEVNEKKELPKEISKHRDIPSWAKYVAQQSDGEWTWYEDTPTMTKWKGGGAWKQDGNQTYTGVKTDGKDWDKIPTYYYVKGGKITESVNEAEDNLYLQLHKKYAEQIKGLKAKKIKKLTDLVSVQRWSMEDREDYFDMDSNKKKELSAEYDEERKLFKKYMAKDYSVMLPKGTESLRESVNEDNRKHALLRVEPRNYEAMIDKLQDMNINHRRESDTVIKIYTDRISSKALYDLTHDVYVEKFVLKESVNEKKKQTNDQSPMSDDGMETGIKNKAKESGVPVGLLRIIMKRGLAAWKTGHRPGATQAQWGYARVNSFLTKQDGTWGGADQDIAKKVRDGGHDKKL